MKTEEQIRETIRNIESTLKLTNRKPTSEWKHKLEILKWVLTD